MGIITAITSVFDEVLTWLIGALTDATAIFIGANGELTLIGMISLLALGFSICLFLFNWVRDVINFRR